MLFHEGHTGVYITPQFYSEVLGAYDAQANFLAQNPGDTHTEAPLSPALRSELWRQVHITHKRAFEPDIYDHNALERPEVEFLRYHPEGAVSIQPNDTEHLIESLLRQAGRLMLDAWENEGTIAGLRAETIMKHKYYLALNMYLRCKESTDGKPRGVWAQAALDYRPPKLKSPAHVTDVSVTPDGSDSPGDASGKVLAKV
jgi:hypothetical protein